MSEKIITCKSGKVVEKEGKEWLELVDHEDKVQRIFPSMLKVDGTWVHLEKEIDELKGLIERNEIEGKTFNLTKEKKGTFYNIIAIEPVKNILVKEAQKQVEDRDALIKARSMILSYCKDLAVADKIKVDQIIPQADKFYNWLEGTETTEPTLKETGKIYKPTAVETTTYVTPWIDAVTGKVAIPTLDMPAPKEAVKQLNSKNPGALKQITTKFKVTKGETLEKLWLRLDDKQKAEFIANVNHSLAELIS